MRYNNKKETLSKKDCADAFIYGSCTNEYRYEANMQKTILTITVKWKGTI